MGERHNAVIRMDLAGTSLTAVVTRQLEVGISAHIYTIDLIHPCCMGPMVLMYSMSPGTANALVETSKTCLRHDLLLHYLISLVLHLRANTRMSGII